MKISNTAAVTIIALVLLGLYLLGGCKMKGGQGNEQFTRTCTSADTNCKFVRTPVDYAFANMSDIPSHQPPAGNPNAVLFPHLMGNITDKVQPLDDPCSGEIVQTPAGPKASKPCGETRIDLIGDENKLWNQSKLWKQYENDYKGCGNGKPYIVNDDKTRFALREVGDEWMARRLENQMVDPRMYGIPDARHQPKYPALTDLDMVQPDDEDALYGGLWLNQMVGR